MSAQDRLFIVQNLNPFISYISQMQVSKKTPVPLLTDTRVFCCHSFQNHVPKPVEAWQLCTLAWTSGTGDKNAGRFTLNHPAFCHLFKFRTARYFVVDDVIDFLLLRFDIDLQLADPATAMPLGHISGDVLFF